MMRSLNASSINPRLRFPPFNAGAAATRRGAAAVARPSSAAPALALVSALAAQSWFRPGHLIATGDNFPSPFVAPDAILERARTVWGYTVTPTGGVDVFSTLQLLPALFAKSIEAVGGSPALSQRAFLTLVFAAVAPSMYVFLRTLLPRPHHVVGAVAGAFFYAFNPIVFFAVPSIVMLLALSLIPLLAALAVRGVRAPSWRYPVGLAAASLALSYLFFNPPTFILVCAVGGAALVVTAWRERRWGATGRLMARTLPLAAIFNLWWIAPALLFYGRHPTVTPTANVSDWSWTHAHASIPNILRLVPIWSWPSPTYFPYAATLERPGLVALAFVPSAVTISSLLVTRGLERRMAVSVVGILAGATLLAKGLHPPLASLNRALYNVPGLWLYREPATKFGMLVAGTLAIGIALFVSSFRSGSGRRNAALGVVAAATIVSFPLWLGRVIADSRPGLAPEHVQIPPYWHELARYLERDPGRTLVLPPDDYYQMPYRWGYYGDDSLPNAVIHSSVVILPNPQPPATSLGYFEPDPGAASLAARLRLALSRRGFADAARFARALGIRWVVVRRDIDARFPARTILDPAALSAQLSRSGAFRPVWRFGALDLFEVPAPRASVWATRSVVSLRPSDPPGAALAVAPGYVTEDVSRQLSSPRLIEPGIERHGALRTFPTRNNERERVTVVERWPRGLASTLVAGPHSVSVVLPTLRAGGRELASFGVGATLPLGPQSSTRLFGLDGNIVETARDGQAPIILSGGAHRLTTYTRADRSVVAGGSFEFRTWKLGNCDASGRPARAVRLAAERVAGGVDGRFALRLSARRDAACEYAPLRGIDASSVYQISLAYRWKHGAPPRLCIWEQEPRRCAPLGALAARTRWTRSTQLFRLEPTTRHASLYLYADAPTGPTAVLYDAVRVERFQPARAATFAVRPVQSWELAHPPSQERKPLRVTIESSRALLVPVRVEGAWSNVADCAATDRRPPGQVGIRELATRAAGGYVVTLEARAHSACVHAPVRAFDPAASYRFSLEYRRVRGAAPRVCVWERGAGRCAPSPPLGESSRWHRIAWSIRPDPGTSGLDVYVYADGVPSGTKVRYRGLTATRLPAAPDVVALDSPAPAAGSPTVSFAAGGDGTEYTVHVEGATEPYVLVLNETFNSGWHLSGTDRARHIRVNEYANGWIVDRPGSYSLTIRYTPQRIVSIARGVSIAGLSATVLFLGALALRRARRRETSACSG